MSIQRCLMKRTLLTAFALTLTLQSANLPAFSAGGLHDGPTRIASSASIVAASPNAIDGTTLLQSVLDKCQDLRCYEFESSLTTYNGNKTVKESGRFYFKSPNMIRFEVTSSSGPRNGAIVVRQPNGSIKVKTGGLFGGMKLTLSKDSGLLKTSNGFSIVDSDFESLLKGAKKKVTGPLKCLATPSPTPYAGGVNAYIIELIEPDGDVAERIALDPKDKLPIEWSIFNNKALFSNVKFNNTRVNTALNDELFSLEKGGSDSKSLEDLIAGGCKNLETLKAADKKELTVPVMHELDRVLNALQQKAQALKNVQLAAGGAEPSKSSVVAESGTTTSDTTPEKSPSSGKTLSVEESQELLKIVTAIDTLVDAVSPVSPALESLDAHSPVATKPMNEQWKDSLQHIAASTGRVLDKLDGQTTDRSFCSEESNKIAAEVEHLTRIKTQALKEI